MFIFSDIREVEKARSRLHSPRGARQRFRHVAGYATVKYAAAVTSGRRVAAAAAAAPVVAHAASRPSDGRSRHLLAGPLAVKVSPLW